MQLKYDGYTLTKGPGIGDATQLTDTERTPQSKKNKKLICPF